MKLSFLPAVCALGACLHAALPAQAADYLAVQLDLPWGTRSSARAINNAGEVAGSLTDSANISRATVWRGGQAIDLNPAGARYSWAADLNDAGQVIGLAQDEMGDSHATLWNGTTATHLIQGSSEGRAINNSGQVAFTAYFPTEGRSQNMFWNGSTATPLHPPGYSNGLNNLGQVVGSAQHGPGQSGHATLWQGATATDLGTLGGSSSVAHGINDLGQAVGYSWIANDAQIRATLWQNGTATDLGTLLAPDAPLGFASAYAINLAGQVVGTSTTEFSSQLHASLWDHGSVVDLNDFLSAGDQQEGWVLTYAWDINDKGQVVGDAYNGRLDEWRAYVLTPVPEPASAFLLLAGAGWLAAASRRRKPV